MEALVTGTDLDCAKVLVAFGAAELAEWLPAVSLGALRGDKLLVLANLYSMLGLSVCCLENYCLAIAHGNMAIAMGT